MTKTFENLAVVRNVPGGGMTLKQFILGALTVVAIAFIGLSLIQSWTQPQIQSRLELYQTNLLLHASEFQGDDNSDQSLNSARQTLIGTDPIKTATEQYQEARQSAQASIEKAQAQLQQSSTAPELADPTTQPRVAPVTEPPSPVQSPQQQLVGQLEQLRNELDLRLGVLQTQQGQTQVAIQTWQVLIQRLEAGPGKSSTLINTTEVLTGLWSDPPRLLPDAEQQLKRNLDGWFRYQALRQLYQLQQRQDALAALEAQEQQIAEQATVKLAIVGGIPAFGFLTGIGLLVFLVIQRLVKGKQSLLSQNGNLAWPTPWGGEITWQVMVLFFVGQFAVGQILLPIALGLVGIDPTAFDGRSQAFYILAIYILLVSIGLLVLYLSLKAFLPLPEGWFRLNWQGNWFWWGLGGYFVALPLVVLVSLINQQLWQGQGGSNPILPIVLEGQDQVALVIFFLTASVAAPLFEEVMFRGFLLPSLTRYLPVWGSITVSGLLFAIAHLSLSEILPLAVLGMVLGFVYTRSRNLLAPMLLHSLWNSGTLLSLFVLGSSST